MTGRSTSSNSLSGSTPTTRIRDISCLRQIWRRAKKVAEAALHSDELCPEDALAKAEAAAEENWNKYLRIVAEMDNLRKRHTRDLENAHRFGVEGLAGELLTVADG